MRPDDVLNQLKIKGLEMSRQTLRRYELQKLISAAKHGCGGRGVGRWTEYNADVLYECVASHQLLTGAYTNTTLAQLLDGARLPRLSVKVVAMARKVALDRDADMISDKATASFIAFVAKSWLDAYSAARKEGKQWKV